MRRQNDLFRTLARAPFGELLGAVVRDPALLVWLDAPRNRKGHPNENLARELMELFTPGHRPFHRARRQGGRPRPYRLEGRRRQAFAEVADATTTDEKAILGHTGALEGQRPGPHGAGTPGDRRRLAWRVSELFLADEALKTADLGALADGLRAHKLDVGWAVETVLRSQLFFAAANLGNRVLGPVEYVVGAARALELFEPPCSTLMLADWCGRLDQDLFYPPNVGGWPGGRSWLTTRGLIGRANYAAALVGPHGVGRPTPLDALPRWPDAMTGAGAAMNSSASSSSSSSGPNRTATGTPGSPRPSARIVVGPRRRPPCHRPDPDLPPGPTGLTRSDPARHGPTIPEVPMSTRRDFLGASLSGSSLIALAPSVPGFLSRTARAAAPRHDDRVLVVLELNGGNDGINTVVPFADEGYAKHRKALRLAKDQLVKVDGRVGLHPSLRGFGKLLEAGQLVIAQGVSYPNPSRSHFQSTATWHTARLDPEDHKGPGWLGRAPRRERRVRPPRLQVGPEPPSVAIRGRRSVATTHRADRRPYPGRRLRPAEGPRRGPNRR